jgi:ribosome maturation factor RimP
MEEMGMYPDGDFSLEVSSPGIDEPLKLLRQYKKNIGRTVAVTGNDNSLKEGKLAGVNENSITLEIAEGKGKKAVTRELEIPFSEIKETKVQVKFN